MQLQARLILPGDAFKLSRKQQKHSCPHTETPKVPSKFAASNEQRVRVQHCPSNNIWQDVNPRVQYSLDLSPFDFPFILWMKRVLNDHCVLTLTQFSHGVVYISSKTPFEISFSPLCFFLTSFSNIQYRLKVFDYALGVTKYFHYKYLFPSK